MEFGRERDGVDLSQVVLTHHILRDRGNRALPLGEGDSPTLKPLTDAGSGSVQEKEKGAPVTWMEQVSAEDYARGNG